ncbi:MAG: O-antigen ligase family protein [Bacteroidales bacterium]|nr:O-antigen ligase family protein [Bacteroidales bacterium]
MTEKLKISVVYLVTALFVFLNTWFVYKEIYIGLLIPIAGILLLMYIFSLENILLLTAFVTPLAINLGDYDFGISISVPSEPLLIGILFFLVLKMLLEGGVGRGIVRHPVTIAILFNLSWMLITSIASDLPVVSLKYFLSQLWFIVPVYFGGIMLFRSKTNIRKFVWTYASSLLIVVLYTTWNHMGFGFSEKAGHSVMTPFYNDHTAYGAVLALFIPVILAIASDSTLSRKQRILAAITGVIFLLGLFLSYSRAAWVSAGFAVVVLVLVKLHIRFSWIAISTVALLVVFFAFKVEILDRLEKNKQDASANFIEHIQSISNISSDASNLERINRWQAAFRMFSEKPVLGWGPGTYQFEYAPFQHKNERTVISTNLGNKGNAHSEYIGPLAESGILGLLSVLFLVITVVYTGLNVYKKANNHQTRLMALSATLGLLTYFVHGLMNNFLNTDKASVPFWGLVACIVALDLYHTSEEIKVQ